MQAGAGHSRRGRQHGLRPGPVTGKGDEPCKGGRAADSLVQRPNSHHDSSEHPKSHFRAPIFQNRCTIKEDEDELQPESGLLLSPTELDFLPILCLKCIQHFMHIPHWSVCELRAVCGADDCNVLFSVAFVVFRKFTARRQVRLAGDLRPGALAPSCNVKFRAVFEAYGGCAGQPA